MTHTPFQHMTHSALYDTHKIRACDPLSSLWHTQYYSTWHNESLSLSHTHTPHSDTHHPPTYIPIHTTLTHAYTCARGTTWLDTFSCLLLCKNNVEMISTQSLVETFEAQKTRGGSLDCMVSGDDPSPSVTVTFVSWICNKPGMCHRWSQIQYLDFNDCFSLIQNN